MAKTITKRFITTVLVICMFVAMFVIVSASQNNSNNIYKKLIDNSQYSENDWKFVQNDNIVAEAWTGGTVGDAVYGTSYWELNCGGETRGPNFGEKTWSGEQTITFPAKLKSIAENAPTGTVQIYLIFTNANEYKGKNFEWEAKYSDGTRITILYGPNQQTYSSADWVNLNEAKTFSSITTRYFFYSGTSEKGEIKDCIIRVRVNDSVNPSTTLTGTATSDRNFATSSSAAFSTTDPASGIASVQRQKATFAAATTWANDGAATTNSTWTSSNSTTIGSGFGDYRVLTADHDLRTGTSPTIRYWIPTLKVTNNGASGGTTTSSATGGTQYIGTALNTTSTSLTRYPSQTFYLRAKADLGYIFDGFDIEYANLNSGLSQNIPYSSFTYDTASGYFYYGITLTDNLCVLGNTYTSVAFKANFSDKIALGNSKPYDVTYNGAEQPFLNNTSYLSITSIGSDREAVVTDYKQGTTWTTAKPKLAGVYGIRVVVRNKSTTTTIYGTYEFVDYTGTNIAMIISRREITISFSSSNKTYDGNLTAATTASVTGGQAGDNIALSLAGATSLFADKIVQDGKTVTFSGFTVTGNNLASYYYNNNLGTPVNLEDQTAGKMGIKTCYQNITPFIGLTLELKLKEAHKNKEKEYNYTNNVDSSWFEVVIKGKIGEDIVNWVDDPYPTAITTASGGSLLGKTVGTPFFESTNIKLTGTDCVNYRVQEKTWNANMTYTAGSNYAGAGYDKITITKKPIGITVTANNKAYDGETTATGSCTLDPVVAGGSGDNLVLASGITYAFDNKHVGTGKTVRATNIAINTGGSSGVGNYTVSFANNTATANISKRNITIAMSCSGKIYNGNILVTNDTLTFTYAGIVATDATDALNGIANPTWIKIGTGVTFAYSNANAGNVTVSAGSIALAGTSAGNYIITNETLTCSASITSKTIVGNVTIAAIGDVTYDKSSHQPLPGLTDTALSSALASPVDFEYSYTGSPTNVGIYTVTITGKNNYQGTLTSSFKIVKANVVIAAENISVTYGANVDSNSIVGTAKNASMPSVELIGGSFSFDASKIMPLTPKVIESGTYVVKYALSGIDAPNYNAPGTINITLTVSKRNITVSATIKTQTFGENAQPLTFTSVDPNNSLSNGIIGTDNLNVVLKCDKTIPIGKTHPIVGSYVIERDTSVSTNPNYNITFNNSTYTILTRSVAISPNGGQNKIYGNPDPSFTYTPSDVVTLGNTLISVLSDCPLVGILSRQTEAFIGGTGNRPGENVGQYRIQQNSLTSENNTNYDIQFSGTTVGFTINKRDIQIKAPILSTIYGEDLVPFTYSVTSGELYLNDELTGSFSRTLNAGSQVEENSVDVKTYVLKDNLTSQSSFGLASNNPNYNISQITNGSYQITCRPLTITPSTGLSKTYGNADPTLTYSISYTGDPEKPALVFSDSLAGSLIRVAGNNVGTYAISKGTLANVNYSITAEPESFTINPLAVVVLAKLWSMDYGVAIKLDEKLTWTTSPASLPFSDTLSGQLYLDPAQWELDEFHAVPVGVYDISQGTVTNANNPNYSITFNGDNRYIINMLIANIKPMTNQSMIYGQTLTQLYNTGITFMAYTNGGEQIAASYFSGKLKLDTAVETPIPGSYEIVQGTLSSDTHVLNMNYEKNQYGIIAECAKTLFVVNKRNISIQPQEVTQVFGEDEITTLPFTIATGTLVGEDALTGLLTRESTGTHLTVGSYNIFIGSVTHLYYNVSIVNNSGKYKVTKRPITINPNAATSVYGQPDSAITYTVSLRDGFTSTKGILISGYDLNGTLSRVNDGMKVVGDYAIILGTLANPNYDIMINLSTVYYSITKRPVSIKANDKSQVFGNPETSLDYSFTGGTRPASWDNGALSPSTQLSRLPGVVAGQYAINEGNMLDAMVNPNYNITFTSGIYTITPKAITITPDGNQSKEYGTLDPVFSYTVSGLLGGLVSGYDLTGVLSREPGESVGGWKITQGTINNADNKNPNYNISFNGFVSFGITQANSVIFFNDSTTLVEEQYVLSLIYNAKNQSVDASLNHTERPITYSISNSFKNVGSYVITLSSLPSTNYKATSVSVVVEIQPYELGNITTLSIVDTLSNLTKTYGDTDKVLEKTIETLENDADLVVQYNRESGESVGLYSLEIAGYNSNNYIVSLAPNAGIDVFEIIKREVILNQISTMTKFYDGNAEESKTINHNGYYTDVIKITCVKESGAAVGEYNIASYSIDLESQENYTLTITDLDNKFIISRRPVYVAAKAITIQYGDAAQDITYEIAELNVNSGLIGTEKLNGEIERVQGSDAGIYLISAGTIKNSNNSNYDIHFTEANYTIAKVNVTVTPNAISVQYGADPVSLSYTLSRELIGSDNLDGDLVREETNKVGSYNIQQGTVSNTDGRNKNYTISFVSNIKYTITKRNISITPTAVTQVYGDDVTPVTYELMPGSSYAYSEETLYGNLGRSGLYFGTYDITIGNLVERNPDYNIELIDYQNKYTITKRPITFTANNKTQVYGDAVQPLTYSATSGNVVYDDTFNGTLLSDAVSEKNVGSYIISGDTIDNTNYDITFINGSYEITPRILTIQLRNQETQYKTSEELLVVLQHAYELTSGFMAYNEPSSVLLIVISKQPGYKMGHYDISATYNNANYIVTFIKGTYIIHKYTATITTDITELTFTYDKNARHINATCDSLEEVQFFIGNTEVNNVFVNPGRYIVRLEAPESEAYYAPTPVTVTISIFKDKLITESNGIDATMITDDGFEPELILNMEKADTNGKEIQNHISRYQDVIRSFNLSIINASDQTIVDKGISSIRIKVPSIVENDETVQVLINQNGVYSTQRLNIEEGGYVTITGENITNISFLQETSGSIMLYAILGIIALIVVIGFGVLLFKKRY